MSVEYTSNTGAVSTTEFDEFGPWIEVLRSADAVPRLFADFPIDFDASSLVLKIPRNISRRDALPTMHLYDHVVIAEQSALTVLTRAGDDQNAGYDGLRIPYEKIASITDSVNLLDGVLTIRTVDGAIFPIAYNGSSEKIIADLLEQVRDAIRRTQPAPLPTIRKARPMTTLARLELDDLGKKDVSFVTAYREMQRREPGLRLLAAHGRSIIATAGDAFSQAAHLAYPATLHGVVLCATNDELQVLARREWIVRRGAPIVSRVRTVIPFHSLTAIERAEHPGYLGVDVVTIVSGAARVEVVLPRDSLAVHALGELAPR